MALGASGPFKYYEISTISNPKTLADFLWVLGALMGLAGPSHRKWAGDKSKEFLINDFGLEFASDFKRKIFNQKFLGLIS